MAKEPNVIIVTGDEDFLRRRFVRDVVADKLTEGWQIDRVDASVEGQLDTVLGSSEGVFLRKKTKTLVVVDHPEDVDPSVYKEHIEDTASDKVLFLHYEGIPAGTTKFGKFVATQKSNHKEYKAPKDWDAPALGAAFCIREAKKHGFTLETQMAEAIVERVGADLGFLSFELLKLSMLTKAESLDQATPDVISQSLAMLLEAETQPVIAALSERDLQRLAISLDRIKKTSRDDSTIPLCRVLGGTAMRWISVVDLKEKGKSPEDAANLLGQHPWYFKNKLLPQVNRWNRKDLVGLLRAVTLAERSVLDGVVSPWSNLVGRLLGVCRGG